VRHRAKGDARSLSGHGAFEALLAAVHGAATGDLAAAGCLGAAPVDGEIVQLQADDAVVGAKDQQAQLLGQTGGDPLVAAAAKGGGRAGGIGNPAVAAAENQDLDELVENGPAEMRARWQPSGCVTCRCGRSACITIGQLFLARGRASRPQDRGS
jgi:hypothetical protein